MTLPASTPRKLKRWLQAGAVAGVVLYATAAVTVLYQSSSACAVSSPVGGDPSYSGRIQLMPARYQCTWHDLPGEPSTTATDAELAVLSVIGAFLFIACAVALVLVYTSRRSSHAKN